MIEGDYATITFVRRLPHPIVALWAAITDPEHRAVWFDPLSIDPPQERNDRDGGRGPPTSAEMCRVSGRILVRDPPRILEHEWEQSLIGDTVVRYGLTSNGDTTARRFTHSRLTDPNAKGYIPGEHP
jgi:uncharacterized protein YndB with AHSA1/START domain